MVDWMIMEGLTRPWPEARRILRRSTHRFNDFSKRIERDNRRTFMPNNHVIFMALPSQFSWHFHSILHVMLVPFNAVTSDLETKILTK